MNKIYIRDSFLESYKSISELYHDNVHNTLVEFYNSSLMKSRRLEKLPAYVNLYSLRVDQNYRLLMVKITRGIYLLVFVGSHEVAYA